MLRLIICGLFIFSISFGAKADEVMLLDSTVYTGEVISLESCSVKIKVKEEKKRFKAEQIAFVRFENPYHKDLKRYRDRLERDLPGCFYVMNLGRTSFENNHDKISIIYGPDFNFTSGGEVTYHTVDNSINDENLALYLVEEDRKKARRKKILMGVLWVLLMPSIF